MVDCDSKNKGVYLCNLQKLEALHDLFLSLQEWLVEVVNPKTVGVRGGGGGGERVVASEVVESTNPPLSSC